MSRSDRDADKNERVEELEGAIRRIVKSWNAGDLAGAVASAASLIEDEESIACPKCGSDTLLQIDYTGAVTFTFDHSRVTTVVAGGVLDGLPVAGVCLACNEDFTLGSPDNDTLMDAIAAAIDAQLPEPVVEGLAHGGNTIFTSPKEGNTP